MVSVFRGPDHAAEWIDAVAMRTFFFPMSLANNWVPWQIYIHPITKETGSPRTRSHIITLAPSHILSIGFMGSGTKIHLPLRHWLQALLQQAKRIELSS